MGDPEDDLRLSEGGESAPSRSSAPSSEPTGDTRGAALGRIQIGSRGTNDQGLRRNLRGSGQPLMGPLRLATTFREESAQQHCCKTHPERQEGRR